jgi:hypothetical protein
MNTGEMKAMIFEDSRSIYDFDPDTITEDVWSFAITLDPVLFENPPNGIPRPFLSQEFLHANVAINGLLAKYLVEISEEDAVAAVNQNPLALEHVQEWRDDASFVKSVMEKKGIVLWAAPTSIRANKEVVLAAVTQDGYALQHASFALRKDKEVCLAAVRCKNTYALPFCAFEHQNDKQVVCASMAHCPNTLEHASFRLKYGGLRRYVMELDDVYTTFCVFDLCQRAVMQRWSDQALWTGDRTQPYANIYGQGPANALRFRLLIKSYLSPCNKAFEEAMIARPILLRHSADMIEEDLREARLEQRKMENRERTRVAAMRPDLIFRTQEEVVAEMVQEYNERKALQARPATRRR